MPFPFHRLHCDLQYRLRDLVTPSELCQLQLALGDQLNCLHTPQRCRFLPENIRVDACEEDGELVLLEADSGTTYDVKNEVLFIHDLLVESDSDEIFDFLRTRTVLILKKLYFYECDLSTLKKYAPYCSKTDFVNLKIADYPKDVNMQNIFTLIPNLRKLYINVYYMENWLHDLVELKVNGLEKLRIELEASNKLKDVFRDRMFCINAKELFQLCKAQQPNFQMRLEFINSRERLEPAIWDLLKPYFRQVENDDDTAKVIITNSLDDECQACFAAESMNGTTDIASNSSVTSVSWNPDVDVESVEENTEFSLVRHEESKLLKLFADDADAYVENTTGITIKKLNIRNSILKLKKDLNFIESLRDNIADNVHLLFHSGKTPNFKPIAKICSDKCFQIEFTEPVKRIKLVFDAFPNLKKLYINCRHNRNNNWLTQLLMANATGLERLCIQCTSTMYKKLKRERLYLLCKDQAPNFQLRLMVWTGELDDSDVWKRLWPYFKEAEDVNEYPKIVVDQYHEYYACYNPVMDDSDDDNCDETPTSSASTSSKTRTSSSEPVRKRGRK